MEGSLGRLVAVCQVRVASGAAGLALRGVGVEAPTGHPGGRDADDLAAHERYGRLHVLQRHRGAADLEAAHRPRVPRDEVVHDEGDLAVGLDVAELAGGAHAMATDEDVAGLLVEEGADRAVLGCAVRIDGGEARQGLVLQVVALGAAPQRKSRLAGTAVPTTSASTRSASKLTAPCPLRTRPRINNTGA